MREQKYANILKDVDDETKTIGEAEDETFEKESVEKLSMTRELKFKELQKHIDETFFDEIEVEDVAEINADDSQDEIDKKFLQFIERENDDILLEKNKKVASNDVIHEEKEDESTEIKDNEKLNNNIDDDIYLTTSFKPFKKRFRFRKLFKVLLFLMMMVGLIGVLIYFVIIPVYNKYNSSKPKAIFDTTIDTVSKKIVNLIENNIVSDDRFYFDVNFGVDSNMEELGFGQGQYGMSMGVDPNKNVAEQFIYMIKDNTKYGVTYYDVNGQSYYNYSTSDKIIEYEKNDDAEENYDDILKYLEELYVGKDNLIYYIERHAEIYKELADISLISSTKDELTIDGETISVTRNTLTIDYKAYINMQKKYIEILEEDEKLLEIAAQLEDLDTSDYLDYLEDSIDEVDDEYEECINIYTIKGNEFVGIDSEVNGFRDFYYYIYKGDFHVYLNLTEDEECLNGGDCTTSNQMIISLEGDKKDNYTEVDIKYNNIDVAILNVRSFTEELIDFDYEVIYEDLSLGGSFKLVNNVSKHLYNVILQVKNENEYIDLNVELGLFTDSEFADFDLNNVYPYTDEIEIEENESFYNQLNLLGIDEVFDSWISFFINAGSYLEQEESVIQTA